MANFIADDQNRFINLDYVATACWQRGGDYTLFDRDGKELGTGVDPGGLATMVPAAPGFFVLVGLEPCKELGESVEEAAEYCRERALPVIAWSLAGHRRRPVVYGPYDGLYCNDRDGEFAGVLCPDGRVICGEHVYSHVQAAYRSWLEDHLDWKQYEKEQCEKARAFLKEHLVPGIEFETLRKKAKEAEVHLCFVSDEIPGQLVDGKWQPEQTENAADDSI